MLTGETATQRGQVARGSHSSQPQGSAHVTQHTEPDLSEAGLRYWSPALKDAMPDAGILKAAPCLPPGLLTLSLASMPNGVNKQGDIAQEILTGGFFKIR
jgi:hypothetical protein